MATVSLCMIVKNEENVLARCLDSLQGLMDEIIIVDTGSTDKTKEIARSYTDLVYDFAWCDDFSAARNFSFSKATMEYIYSADADEVLDKENRKRFAVLKQAMLPEIELVQMLYVTPDKYNTVQNAARELRPKLFRRLRTFTWINPVHETVRLDPVVYNSDIEILHMPEKLHGKRDFTIFLRSYERNGSLPKSLVTMYAKELLKCGTREDFADAAHIFEELYYTEPTEESVCILARYYREANAIDQFFKVALKNIAIGSCSEVCYELGSYYLEHNDYDEAALWFENAAFHTQPALIVESSGHLPLAALADCYERKAYAMEASLHENRPKAQLTPSLDLVTPSYLREQASSYRRQANEWTMPKELG